VIPVKEIPQLERFLHCQIHLLQCHSNVLMLCSEIVFFTARIWRVGCMCSRPGSCQTTGSRTAVLVIQLDPANNKPDSGCSIRSTFTSISTAEKDRALLPFASRSEQLISTSNVSVEISLPSRAPVAQNLWVFTPPQVAEGHQKQWGLPPRLSPSDPSRLLIRDIINFHVSLAT
jgi:hypothetical protein